MAGAVCRGVDRFERGGVGHEEVGLCSEQAVGGARDAGAACEYGGGTAMGGQRRQGAGTSLGAQGHVSSLPEHALGDSVSAVPLPSLCCPGCPVAKRRAALSLAYFLVSGSLSHARQPVASPKVTQALATVTDAESKPTRGGGLR